MSTTSSTNSVHKYWYSETWQGTRALCWQLGNNFSTSISQSPHFSLHNFLHSWFLRQSLKITKFDLKNNVYKYLLKSHIEAYLLQGSAQSRDRCFPSTRWHFFRQLWPHAISILQTAPHPPLWTKRKFWAFETRVILSCRSQYNGNSLPTGSIVVNKMRSKHRIIYCENERMHFQHWKKISAVIFTIIGQENAGMIRDL